MRIFKSRVFLMFTVVFIIFSLCACSSGSKQFSTEEIAERLCKVDKNATYVKLASEQISSFFNISSEALEEYAIYIADDENLTNTIAVFKISGNNKAEVLEAINTYVSGLSKTFELSNVSEFKKLNARVIMELNENIVLVVSDNIQNITEELTDMGGKTIS